jgi:hypothetical protein
MLIGLIGFIGSGKGTVGDMLQNEFGYVQDSFARPLKDAVAAIFGWDRQLLEGVTPESRLWREVPDPFWSEKFGYPFTPRSALQLMGTEAGRNVFHTDIWVISLLHRNQHNNVVVTDVRFQNEIAAIKKNNGMVVRVRRGSNPDWFHTAYCANKGNTAAKEEMKQLGIHLSEWDWIGTEVDHTIYNDGTLADLRNNTRGLAEMAQNHLTSSP